MLLFIFSVAKRNYYPLATVANKKKRSTANTGIPFIFDDFHFCRSRVIGLDMTENRIFTLRHMIQM